MAYQKYKDIPNRREPLAGRDHIQHIETNLSRVVPGPGEVIVGSADGPVAVAASSLGGIETTVDDAVGEWWVHPVATYQDRPYPRTVFGAIASDGTILACEFNHGTGTTKRYEVAQAGVDDHNVPAIWIEAGRRPLIVWTNHDQTTTLHMKVGSRSGDLGAFTTAPEITQSTVGSASYSQVHRIAHLSDETQDTFWIFFRRSSVRWAILPVTIQQASGGVSFGSQISLTQTDASTQSYLTTADAHRPEGENQVIRCALAHNPARPTHPVYYFEIDCVTGAISSPTDAALSANLNGTNLPLIQTGAIVPVLPDPGEGRSRRLFYVRPGPDTPAIAYADWEVGTPTTPDHAVYTVVEINGVGALLPTAASGYAQANYRPGMDDTQGFTYTVAFKTPTAAPAQSLEVGSRYVSPNGWYLRVTTDKKVDTRLRRAGGDVSRVTSDAIPFEWGDTIGLRWQVDMATGAFERFYSLNPLDDEPTWTEIGASNNTITAGDTVNQGPDPLVVPAKNAANRTAVEVYYADYKDASGATIASVNWFADEWNAQDATHTDAAGTTWQLAGDASIRNGLQFSEYGESGPRVGYSSTANYIAGMSFENPSYDRAVIVARSQDGVERVEKFRGTADEVLAEQPTTAGRLVRPYAPVNGGPFRALVTHMTHYGAVYTEYEGKVRGVS